MLNRKQESLFQCESCGLDCYENEGGFLGDNKNSPFLCNKCLQTHSEDAMADIKEERR